jgi:small-conductance mechanosensitive channel
MGEGGRGGSRVDTLLELLRKFIISVLFVLVSLISLSSLGLAIGFGSQTLVRDILTGVFF